MTPRVLVVEDDESMLETLRDVFEQEGKTVVCAGTGRDAMNAFYDVQPDLVLLDIRLPDTDGLTLLRKIKEDGPEQLVIIMTAYPEVPTAIEAMKNGAYDYINKPFELDELRIVVQKALETLQLKDEVNRLRRQREAVTPR
ncbi:MAG: response regulator, partial [bacterium]|nr:response regulator [bacterium]